MPKAASASPVRSSAVLVLLLCCCALGASTPLEIRQRFVRDSGSASDSVSASVSASVSGLSPSSPLVDLNRASVGELEALPGIGPVMAGRIVEHREEVGRFRRVTDLVRVRGIGPAKLERLWGRVSAGVEAETDTRGDGKEQGVEKAALIGGHPVTAAVRPHEPTGTDQVVDAQ